MTIQTKLSEKDFISASLAVMVNKVRYKTFILIFIAVCIFNFLRSAGKSGNWVATVVPFIIVVTLFGIVLYFSLKKAYRKTPRAAETKIYTFNQDNVLVTGESFTIRFNWKSVQKVSKTKNWIFIYESNFNAHPIALKDFSELELETLKGMLQDNGVKNNL